MQEELEQKSVAISIKAGKLTANLLKKAVEKALAEMEKSQKNPKIYKGKQSVKHLVRQGAGGFNIEVTNCDIKSFERVTRKYGVDFARKKDTTKTIRTTNDRLSREHGLDSVSGFCYASSIEASAGRASHRVRVVFGPHVLCRARGLGNSPASGKGYLFLLRAN